MQELRKRNVLLFLLRKGKEMSKNKCKNCKLSDEDCSFGCDKENLFPCNDGRRSSDVLLSTIDELEKVKKERDTYYEALMSIQYCTTALGGSIADMKIALCQIDNICDCALRPDEMKEMEKNNGI